MLACLYVGGQSTLVPFRNQFSGKISEKVLHVVQTEAWRSGVDSANRCQAMQF